MGLKELYAEAAGQANKAGISAGDEASLVEWIRQNCKYREGIEFFLVLGIGCELADIQAKEQGFKNEVDRAWNHVLAIPGNKEKHENWLKRH
jgi:hypothetical protein